jgi:hypothetical protein
MHLIHIFGLIDNVVVPTSNEGKIPRNLICFSCVLEHANFLHKKKKKKKKKRVKVIDLMLIIIYKCRNSISADMTPN